MIIRMYKYYEYIKKSEDRYELRLEMVQEALENGIKPTARKYSTTVQDFGADVVEGRVEVSGE